MGTAEETVGVRLGETATDAPGVTIRPPRGPVAAKRELPSISVDLRGTMPGAGGGAGSSEGRDLEVLRTLGEGGMARVFLARQHSLDRDVAIKTVRDVATEVERRALLSEGAITGHLEHPCVIPVHALGIDHDGRPALVMKWVEGATWSERLADEAHGLDAHLEILMQVCNAVSFAHSRGIVHRDIKPENVLLGRYGEVYLADWGIALRIADQAEVEPLCGTPSYMAPEMVVGGTIDERTDVYMLGAVLHRVLSGRPRHVATNVRATLMTAMESAVVEYGADVPPPLAALANAATSVEPNDRPATAAAFRQGVSDYLRHKGSIALATSALERVARLRTLAEESPADAQIDLLAAETRFAVDEALRGWSDNAEAKRAEGELGKVLEARRTRAAELEQLARELDPGVSRPQRVIALVALAVVALGLAVPAFVGPPRAVTTEGLFEESFAPLVIVAVAQVALRKRLFTTAINRRANGLLLLGLASVTVHRGFALLAAVPAAKVLFSDAMFGSVLCAAGALLVFRWLAAPAAILLAAAFWAAAIPSDAVRAFAAGAGAAILACVAFSLRGAR